MRCERCNAEISVSGKTCPLCHNELVQSDSNAESVFPIIRIGSKREKLFVNIVTLVLFASSIVCVMMNLALFPRVAWSLFVVGGAVCLWSSLILALKARRHLPKAIFWEVVFVAALAVIWDALTGWHGWSLDFIIPLLFSGAIVIIGIVSFILKLALNDYIVYIISNGILGMIPLIFILTGTLNVVVPSMICVCISLISIGILFIFERDRFLEELQRRTHI